MVHIPFVKMNGTGNDFVMIDHRAKHLKGKESAVVKSLCKPRVGIGADGVILIENSSKADFKMRIFNADGSEAEMCGNGARCAVQYALELGLVKKKSLSVTFETFCDVLSASILEDNQICVRMSNPCDFRNSLRIEEDEDNILDVFFVNTGVPHAVLFVDDVDAVDLPRLGACIRYHALFSPNGTNVNFVQVIDHQTIKVRTYERGVEAETFACGTGSTAAAILSCLYKDLSSSIKVNVAGGELFIRFKKDDNSKITEVDMIGSTTKVFLGGYDYV